MSFCLSISFLLTLVICTPLPFTVHLKYCSRRYSLFLFVVCHSRHPSPFNATEGRTKQESAKSKAASIMRATLSRRDQQRLNCIRDSRRTAHKFSSRRRAILLLNTFSRVRTRDSTDTQRPPPPFFFISRLSRDLQPSECSSVRLSLSRLTILSSFLFFFSCTREFIELVGENFKSVLRNRK